MPLPSSWNCGFFKAFKGAKHLIMCASGADKQHRSNSKFTQGNLAGNMTNLKFSPTQLKLVPELAKNRVRLWLNSLKAISSDHLQRLALKWARNMQITPSKHPLSHSLSLSPSLSLPLAVWHSSASAAAQRQLL